MDLGGYLLGIAYLTLLIGFACLGATALRLRLLPDFSGAPAWLAVTVLAAALLIWVGELLGTLGIWKAVPYLIGMGLLGFGLFASFRGWRGGRGVEDETSPAAPPSPHARTRGWAVDAPTLIALLIAAAAVIHFADGVRLRLGTGMTGFDSTWYHGPFAAGFFQTGNTWDLHFIAPQFLAWFYPANSELFHAMGMLAFDRDVVSPLLNLGWFIGCLVAVWCMGRPFGVAPFSLALGAIALNVSALADQAGEARNDIVGTLFLLAAVAIALNAWSEGGRRFSTGALIVTGLAAGLAAGTKLNFLLPAAVLVAGLVAVIPSGERRRALVAAGLPALAGGGYWYLRNLAHTGNPLPWIDSIGPISLHAPDQALGGRDAHSVLSYFTDTSVWSDWFLPGLHAGFGLLWPLLATLAIGGLVLCLGRGAGPLLRVAGLTGLAVAVAWLVAPTSASGPEGMPRGFESGLRYLAPALVLGLALLPAAPQLRQRLLSSTFVALSRTKHELMFRGRLGVALGCLLVALVVAGGYPVQRHYLESRYADPSFTTPGLNAAFRWSRTISDARIATTSTRQYPLYGTDLSNHVDYIGIERPHGGFIAPATCQAWRRLLNAGDYDYVVASFDRTATGKRAFPPSSAWTEDSHATLVLSKPPTVVFKLRSSLDPSACR
ncbi:MAG TPA: hypothetical protein VF176_07150 [Solirubrobacterales bacterium]